MSKKTKKIIIAIVILSIIIFLSAAYIESNKMMEPIEIIPIEQFDVEEDLSIYSEFRLKEQYEESATIVKYFNNSYWALNYNITIEDDNGNTLYQLLEYRTVTTMKNYLSAFFSNELIDELMNNGRIVEKNGYLYMQNNNIGMDQTKGGESYYANKISDELVEYIVTVETVDPENGYIITGSEEYIFNYELIDGEWKFTSFPKIR